MIVSDEDSLYLEKMPIVSVIISTYNRVSLLARAIKSIQRQTVRNIEILVCDDGSTDDTEKTVNRIAEKDSRVKYLNCGHSGRPSIPRNIGIKNARGERLAFIDDDDEWKPVKLEVELFLAKKHTVRAVCANAHITEENGHTGKLYFDLKDRIYTFKDFLGVNPVINSSMMIHNSLLRKMCWLS